MPNEQFFSYVYIIWWDDDEVRFVLDQHTQLDFYSAGSLKQHSTFCSGKFSSFWAKVFAITPEYSWILHAEAANTNLTVFGFI